jgi:hypothetical protein
VQSPSERRLRVDLASPDFEAGVAAGMWEVRSVIWPRASFAVRTGSGEWFGMGFDLEGYPAVAPAGQPWDLKLNVALPVDRWPTGGSADLTFRRDWSIANGGAPYIAADRVSLATHPDWATAHPERAWNPARTIAFYLAEIHRELGAAILAA